MMIYPLYLQLYMNIDVMLNDTYDDLSSVHAVIHEH